jgi:hypothetical protein
MQDLVRHYGDDIQRQRRADSDTCRIELGESC